jgi:hypothetical protein
MFARQPGILLALTALANAIAYTPISDALSLLCPSQFLQVVAHVAGVALVFFLVYLGNVALILLFARPELEQRVIGQLQERILASVECRPPRQVYRDNLDRTAQFRILVHRLAYRLRLWN